jgi:hypothetical protein
MKKTILIFFLFACFKTNAQLENIFGTLISYMSGSFSSEAQSKVDSNFYDIRLHMTPIQMNNEIGVWFYVEQAMATMQDKPYRQRLYQVVEIGLGNYESRVYEFENPLQYAGAWKDISKLDSLTFEKLTLREGCSIALQYEYSIVDGISINKFVGATGATTCSSSLRGASYATSEVVISWDKLVSWDRGWDATGKQVWGAVTAGYVFDKVTD